MKSYLIYGLMRSGSHAIIEWIAAHFGRTAHYNDITRLTPRDYVEYGDPDSEIDCTIYSVETGRPFAPVHNRLKRPVPLAADAEPIAILRDYYNTQASLIEFSKKYPWARFVYKEHKRLWPLFAASYIERPQHFVIFNWWVEHADYTRGIETLFGWHHVPNLRTLPTSRIGFGSSFDGTGQLQYAGLNSRWKLMASDDPEWEDALACPAAKELNEKIFGWSM